MSKIEITAEEINHLITYRSLNSIISKGAKGELEAFRNMMDLAWEVKFGRPLSEVLEFLHEVKF